MSPIASDGGGAANISSDSRPRSNQGSTPVKTPGKQQQQRSHQRLHTSQAPLPADEPPPARTSTPRRLHPGTGRTATAPDQDDSECATPTPAPHRYGRAAPVQRQLARALRSATASTSRSAISSSGSGILAPRAITQQRSNNSVQLRTRNRNRNSLICTCSHSTRPPASIMASGGKWREEQILIICPGSRTTMAQLGCGELSPPAHRIPTRMFRDEEEPEQWRPYYTYKRTTVTDGVEHEEWVEDVDEDKGAVWPIEGGRIVQMDAFLAFLDHVHGLLTTTYHNTPIMLMASPQWTRPDCETIARYIFEKTKTPALCLIHSGIATHYGLKWPNMTVVDIGYEKVDVTAIHDGRVVNHMDLGRPLPDRFISGGEVFTQKLLKLLEGQGFNHDMAEQLKKSGICEVLPYAPAKKELMDLPVESSSSSSNVPQSQPRPTAPATTAEEGAAPGSGAAESTVAAAAEAAGQSAPATDEPAVEEDVAMEDNDGLDAAVDEDGVLDVATIVTSGQTKEFLAKKEKEKEKGKPGRKSNKDKEGDAAAQARPLRQPNSKKVRNTFFYEEIVMEEVSKEVPAPAPAPAPTQDAEGSSAEGDVATEKAAEPAAQGTQAEEDSKAPAPVVATETEAPVVKTEESKPDGNDKEDVVTDSKPAADVANGEQGKDGDANAKGSADADPDAKANTDADPDANPSSTNNGEPRELRPKRIRREIEVGLERFLFADRDEIDRIVSTIYRTIQGVEDMYMRPACWDNLVLSKNGFEEAMFLGAQVAARIAFCLHSNMDAQAIEAQKSMSLSRVDYNEHGPKAIRTHSMLG
ncbi:hypothetical protein M440DRAFT_1460280 [Trichoderma longibrachiatum ATCC 18648]|uniref:Actin-like ATPase domain-containing protein n=1 Tax=Trichoderma longibrachiatum ATCC 18648 TaxID=983965 RepID=A0A2T4CFI7_TRILO|nr:hypothetical protein M440DRAFT_1460280 [Trichoderma longibrachiatum ATCC 18648]